MAVHPQIEQETILTFDKAENTWHFYSDVPSHCKKWQDLVTPTRSTVEPNGTISELEGDIVGNVTISKKRKYTDEQRQQLADRLASYRK